MITQIEVRKNQNENNGVLLRKFSRRVQESGIIRKVKSERYRARAKSKISIKGMALKRIARAKTNDRLRKLGKIV